jgi:hypothetical protein
MLGNVSSLVNVRWFLGIPFNDTSNLRLGIAEQGEKILGGYLAGLQVGNEPDLYAGHGHRPANYSPSDYFGEFGVLVNAMANDPSISNQNLLVGPNIATGAWSPEMVWNTGFVPAYSTQLAYLAVEQSVTFSPPGLRLLIQFLAIPLTTVSHNSVWGHMSILNWSSLLT